MNLIINKMNKLIMIVGLVGLSVATQLEFITNVGGDGECGRSCDKKNNGNKDCLSN